jgi:membrane protease YdiL (CAAX protease family)
MTRSRSGTARIAWLAILFEAGLLLVAQFVGWLLGVSPLEGLRATLGAVAWGLLATAPLFAGMLLLSRSSWGPLQRISDELDEHLVPLFRNCTTLELALIALAAGFGEEALFRGALQAGLGGLLSSAAGIIVASVLFGAAHMITPMYAVLAALVGLYLGGLFIWSDNLFVVIVTHASYDFVALSYLISRRPPPAHIASASR